LLPKTPKPLIAFIIQHIALYEFKKLTENINLIRKM